MSKPLPAGYTTGIDAGQSANEIAELVRKYGAREYGVRFDDNGEPIALRFTMTIPDVGPVPVELRAQHESIYRRLIETDRKATRTNGQARRIAWRQLKTYVQATLELVENGVKPFHEVFMADVLLPTGDRLADAYLAAGGRLALASGTVIDADAEIIE